MFEATLNDCKSTHVRSKPVHLKVSTTSQPPCPKAAVWRVDCLSARKRKGTSSDVLGRIVAGGPALLTQDLPLEELRLKILIGLHNSLSVTVYAHIYSEFFRPTETYRVHLSEV